MNACATHRGRRGAWAAGRDGPVEVGGGGEARACGERIMVPPVLPMRPQ